MISANHIYKTSISFSLLRKRLLLIFILIILSDSVFCQASNYFIIHGDVFSPSCGGASFVPVRNPNWQTHNTGSLLLKNQIDLSQPFTSTFLLEFIDTLAEDGVSIIFQQDSASMATYYYGLGYRDIDKSIAITFDAFKNGGDNDPDFDHIAIQSNGDLDHSTVNNLAGPISIENLYRIQINPGFPSQKIFYHIITLKWDPATNLLSVLIDNVPYISLQQDIVKKIFNNNPKVYWGFGGSNSQPKYYPADAELTMGYARFSFGTIIPRFRSDPQVDSCFAGPITFYDSSIYITENIVNNLQLFKWYWEFGDGTISTLQNPPPHNYPGPGIYLFKFTATNQIGCTSDTLIRTIGLGSKPKVDFTTTATCTNAAVIFNDATINAVGVNAKWLWNLDDNNISSEQNPIVKYTSAGLKKITLAVRTEYGCEADTTKIIEITDNPVIDFTFLQDCNSTVQYNAVLINGVTIDKWYWNFGDRNFSSLRDPLHKFQQNGSYPSTLRVISNKGCESTITKPVEIDKVYPYAGNDTIISVGQPLQLNGSGGTNYQWMPSTGLNNPIIANPVAILTSNQTYILSVKNKEGCESRDTINIKVYKGPDIYVPNAFSPNNDGVNDRFHVVAPGFSNGEITIFNRLGELIFKNNLQISWNGKYKGLEAPPGAYVWVITGIDYKGVNIQKKGIVILIR